MAVELAFGPVDADNNRGETLHAFAWRSVRVVSCVSSASTLVSSNSRRSQSARV